MSLDVGLYELNGKRIATTTKPIGVTFSFNRRGPAALTAFWPCDFRRAFDLRNATNKAEIIVRDGAAVVWRGTVEDRRVTAEGYSATAFGRQRLLTMPLYTGFWSASTSAGWREITSTDAPAISGMKPEMFVFDNNNRLFIGTKKGATYANGDRCELSFAVPHLGHRAIVHFTATYAAKAPTGWEYRLTRMDDDYTNRTTVTTITATGSDQSGTLSGTFAFTGQARISVGLLNNTGSASSPAGEDGENYLRLTNIRVTSQTTPILASDIATALADYSETINAGFINAKQVSTTTQDLQDENYEDARPSEILDYLALREGFEWGVDNEGVFYFRQRGSASKTYKIDAEAVVVEESIANLVNVAYARYQDANGRTRRTAINTDTQSVSVYGIKRYSSVTAATTSAASAAVWRDARLDNAAQHVIRASVSFTNLFDKIGTNTPLYYLRPGDRLRIRNLPVTLAPDLDVLREFIVDMVEYDVDSNTIRVEPDVPVPTLVTLVAQKKHTGE